MADEMIACKGEGVTRAQLALNRAAGVKRCYRCDGTKPFAEFAKSKDRSDGLHPICRSCSADYRRERTERDPGWQKRQSAKRRREQPEKVRAEARAQYHKDVEHARALNRAKRAADPERYRQHGRRYREANPEKMHAAKKASKAKKPEHYREANRAYREANKEKIRERNKAYYEANRDAIRERERTGRLRRRAENPELVERQREFVRRYHAENPDRCREIRRNRKARIRGAEGSHTAADIAEILKLQNGKCAHPWCRVKLGKKYDVDHIVAIARGGTNDRRNLQILCRPCNAKKWAKDALDVARENGLLI